MNTRRPNRRDWLTTAETDYLAVPTFSSPFAVALRADEPGGAKVLDIGSRLTPLRVIMGRD